MLVLAIIALVVALVFLAGTIFFSYKYLTIKKLVKEYEEIGTGRYGFYNFGSSSSSYRAIVYVDELDRYTDGYSKIRINRIEPTSISSYKRDSKEKAENDFISLKLTSEIEWLESEDHIKKLRKEKLDKLNKV